MHDVRKVESIDFLLAQVCRLHYIRAHELLETLGLYRGQPPLLQALWEREGLSHTELAESLQISPATTTKMIQRLEKAGFVQRRSDARDQRLSRVYLTEAGRAIRSQVQAVWAQMEAETFAGLSGEEKDVLQQVFKKILSNLGEGLQEP